MSITKYERGIPTYKDDEGNEIGLICETKEKCITDDNGVSLESKLQQFIDGTQQVGDTGKLNGHEAEYFATQEGLNGIQNNTGRTFVPMGKWYRIAEREGISRIMNDSCFIELKRQSTQSETYLIRLESTYVSQRFTTVSSKNDPPMRLINKIRYTYDGTKTYIEAYINYYNATAAFGFSVSLFDLFNYHTSVWKALPFVETEESVSGVTITTTADIQANVSLVNDYEIYTNITWNQLTPDNCVNTTYYKDSFANGIHNLSLVNPSITWARMQLASGNIAGHKIYVRITADADLCKCLTYSHEDGSTNYTLEEYTGQPRVIITPAYNYLSFHFNDYWSTHTTAQLQINTFDLTLMFGAGNEPTMEQFDRMFPDSFYEYNTGMYLSNVRAQGVKLAENMLPKNCETLSTSILEKALEVGIGIHNYHLDGGNYTGNDLPTSATNQYIYSSATIVKRKSNSITVVLWGAGYYQMQLNNYSSNGWHGWVGFLPLSGGTLSDKLKWDNVVGLGEVFKANDRFYLRNTPDKTQGAKFTELRIEDGKVFVGIDKNNGVGTVSSEVLHTGNKPTGTYTGNGSVTYRTISTGGIGNFAIIYSENGTVLLTHSGGAVIKDGNISGFLAGNFRDGVIAISATDTFINASGVTYKYEVH